MENARTRAALCLPGFLFLAVALGSPAQGGDWPQFRGPNSSGVSEETSDFPLEVGPERGVAWSTPLPPGISSPVVAGGRIYLTAIKEKRLLTLALDAASGRVLWERAAPAERIEEVHPSSSPAASTPATDGERVVVFFGSYGLLAYDREGKELWRLPLGPFKNNFGSASSPILTGSLAIQNCDQDQGSFLVAVDKATGEQRFRIERPEFPRGFSTPFIWDRGVGPEIVVAGTLQLKAYSPKDGHELWSLDGLARIVNPTPAAGAGLLFVSSFSPGGDTTERIAMPSFASYTSANDRDHDGRLVKDEVPDTEMKNRFAQIDADKDGFITIAEWERMARIFDAAKNSVLALRPGEGGKTPPVAWRFERSIPYVPSPLCYKGRLYLVKDGGITTILDAAGGALVTQMRLPAGGSYYSSPVAGGGFIYFASLQGDLTVAAPAETGLEVRARAALGETCAATPALAGGRLYVRTERRLIAFARLPPTAGAGGGR